jgi:hypothetical protein
MDRQEYSRKSLKNWIKRKVDKSWNADWTKQHIFVDGVI